MVESLALVKAICFSFIIS